VRELIPTARISRGDGPAWRLPAAERDIGGLSFRSQNRELSIAELLAETCTWVLERAAGTRLHELIAGQLWQPMGVEFDAEITVDSHGNPMADGGICATLRDVARFGQLFLQGGQAGGRQIVPAPWIADTIRGAPDGPAAFRAGDNPDGYPPRAHYRNCWWIRDPDLPFYHASGINGQHVFIHVPSPG
jgi:CubicO group peptidase (beta-lactamase class C family)